MRQTPTGFVELHRPHLRKRRVDRAVRSKGRGREGGFGRFMYQYQELTPFSAEFFDEELGQVALLQERVGEGEVRWHEII